MIVVAAVVSLVAIPHVPADALPDPPGEWQTIELVAAGESLPADAVATVTAAGGRLLGRTDRVLLARVPTDTLSRVRAAFDGEVREPLVVDIRPERVDRPAHYGPTAGAAVDIIGAEAWHLAGHTGAGVRVGVIDFFDTKHWVTAEHGPLPVAGVTAKCLDVGADCTGEFFDGVDKGGDDHGVAVVEAMLDIAPGAQIYIGRATTITDYQALVQWFSERGVKVINRSLGSRFDGPGDGRSALNDVAADAVRRGMVWVNSGGNNADGGYYRHAARVIGDRVAFGPDGDSTFLRFRGCVALAGVRWANDWDLPPSQRTDYDAYLWESPTGNPAAGVVVQSSERRQRLGAAPLEHLPDERCPAPGNSLYLELRVRAGSPDGDVIEILDYKAGMANFTQAPYSSAVSLVDSKDPGVIAVGAIDPAAGGTIAKYSGQGPTNDGRVVPDLVAPAGFVSVASKFFAGTSASAAVVSGAIALVLAAPLAVEPLAAGDFVRQSVLDRGAPGPDNVYGNGELRLPPPPTAIAPTPARFRALDVPRRLLDSRAGGAPPVQRGDITKLPVVGRDGIPSVGVTAVAVNLITIAPDRASWMQALPTNRAALGAFSNVNVDAAGQIRSNFAIVPVGDGGTISLYSTGTGHVVVDALGWFEAAPGATAGGRFVPLATAQRVLDTRGDPPVAPISSGTTRAIPMPAGVPAAEVAALVLTITAASPSGHGWLQAYPADRPDVIATTSNLNTAPLATVANTVIVPVGSTGAAVTGAFDGGGSSHVVVDVVGYITSSTAAASGSGRMVAVRPGRALDTRSSIGTLVNNQTVDVDPSSAPGVVVPATATGVIWNLTMANAHRPGWARAWAAGTTEPTTSSLNWTFVGEIRAASTVSSIAGGRVRVRVVGGTQSQPVGDLVADVFGYFT